MATIAASRGRGVFSFRRLLTAALLPAVCLSLSAAPAPAQRAPVLRQVKTPHAYYFREMLIPQLTTGPSAAAWSPDGLELIYSMQGSLWRQRLDDVEARQLTDGPGYDYQPDWSPDGRRVVYASYRDDAIALRLLDLDTGRSSPLVANGAVNIEPRWSPDGTRVAYTSSAHEGLWHVFVVPAVRGGPSVAPDRVTTERESGLPRYYYHRKDQYLSPTWSSDGRELILVSNRGRDAVERTPERVHDAPEKTVAHRHRDGALPRDDPVARTDAGEFAERHRQQGAVAEADDLRRQDRAAADDVAHLAQPGARPLGFDQEADHPEDPPLERRGVDPLDGVDVPGERGGVRGHDASVGTPSPSSACASSWICASTPASSAPKSDSMRQPPRGTRGSAATVTCVPVQAAVRAASVAA
jgi:hypothetical protein